MQNSSILMQIATFVLAAAISIPSILMHSMRSYWGIPSHFPWNSAEKLVLSGFSLWLSGAHPGWLTVCTARLAASSAAAAPKRLGLPLPLAELRSGLRLGLRLEECRARLLLPSRLRSLSLSRPRSLSRGWFQQLRCSSVPGSLAAMEGPRCPRKSSAAEVGCGCGTGCGCGGAAAAAAPAGPAVIQAGSVAVRPRPAAAGGAAAGDRSPQPPRPRPRPRPPPSMGCCIRPRPAALDLVKVALAGAELATHSGPAACRGHGDPAAGPTSLYHIAVHLDLRLSHCRRSTGQMDRSN